MASVIILLHNHVTVASRVAHVPYPAFVSEERTPPKDMEWRMMERGGTDQAVHSSVDLCVDVLAILLSVLDGNIDEALVSRLAGSGENQRRVGRCVLIIGLASDQKTEEENGSHLRLVDIDG